MSISRPSGPWPTPTRREILTMLKGGRMPGGRHCRLLRYHGRAVSRHLSILREAGLIRDERDGKYIYYELNASVLEEIMLWLTELQGGRNHD